MSQTTEAAFAQNPYASPVNDETRPAAPTHLDIASNSLRFFTFVIDYVGVTICSGAFGFVVGLLGGAELLGLNSALGFAVMIVYYFGFEAAFGRTPGKMVVGTRVVTLTGGEPSVRQCLKRSAVRLVPFEPFSFFGANAVGWHDKWSDTRVIRTR